MNLKTIKKAILIILMSGLLASLHACSRQSHSPKDHMMTLESHSLTQTLFYPGVIRPLSTSVITSPADGLIMDMPIQYGEQVKSGQLLFVLSSTKFLLDYKTGLLAYLKAKSEFSNSKAQLDEASFLHKHGLISDDDFKSKQTNFYFSQLAFLQAKDGLDSLLRQLGVNDSHLYDLSIADFNQITEAIHLHHFSELRISAPTDGVLLSPSKNIDDNKKLTQGDTVKQGDALAMIGNMHGISVQVKVNELIINQLKIGQPIFITGIAFPDEQLKGVIHRVDKQGDYSTSGQPTFNVEAIVPLMSKAQQNKIHVGMSATVAIVINNEAHLLVPIKALTEKNGQFYVKQWDKKTNLSHLIAVKTGPSTERSVAILSGLKAGDHIVLPD